MAKANALGPDFETAIDRLVSETPIVIQSVAAGIPAGFPAAVSGRIFDGLQAQAGQLESGK